MVKANKSGKFKYKLTSQDYLNLIKLTQETYQVKKQPGFKNYSNNYFIFSL